MQVQLSTSLTVSKKLRKAPIVLDKTLPVLYFENVNLKSDFLDAIQVTFPGGSLTSRGTWAITIVSLVAAVLYIVERCYGLAMCIVRRLNTPPPAPAQANPRYVCKISMSPCLIVTVVYFKLRLYF